MSGYRDDQHEPWCDRWWLPADRWRLSYIFASLGFGLLAIALGNLVTGGSLTSSAIAAAIGAGLLAFGLRTY